MGLEGVASLATQGFRSPTLCYSEPPLPTACKLLNFRVSITYKQEVAGSSPALPTMFPKISLL
jgi:hypothetical protein